MPQNRRIEIGFSGGQVTGTRVPAEALEDLEKALESGKGWHRLAADDGELVLNLSQVVFLRLETSSEAIGFGGA